jgi:predicted TIM-barrel fold metal-dependent hydrolase
MTESTYTSFRSLDVPIIDADAHVQEPAGLWVEHVPARLKDRAPRVEHRDDGDWWVFDDGKASQPLGLTACAGRSFVEYRRDGMRYEELRPGMNEATARLADLDADGIWAQVLYPSVTLAGAKTYSDDRELQRYCVRTYNEWITDLCGGGQGRLFAQAIVPTTGIDDAVEELQWAVEHDHRGVVISRFPTGEFDCVPEDDAFFALAEEAGMPVAVHIGSFLRANPNHRWRSPDDLRYLGDTGASKSGGHTLPVACDLLFSGVFERFPDLQVVLVESNIGWIPTMLEQCDDMFLRYRWFTGAVEKMSRMPSEIFDRSFWATFMIDTVGLELRHHLNLDHIMWSTDYPHSGTDWPNSRITMDRQFRGLPLDEVRRLVHSNARALYRIDPPVA